MRFEARPKIHPTWHRRPIVFTVSSLTSPAARIWTGKSIWLLPEAMRKWTIITNRRINHTRRRHGEMAFRPFRVAIIPKHSKLIHLIFYRSSIAADKISSEGIKVDWKFLSWTSLIANWTEADLLSLQCFPPELLVVGLALAELESTRKAFPAGDNYPVSVHPQFDVGSICGGAEERAVSWHAVRPAWSAGLKTMSRAVS